MFWALSGRKKCQLPVPNALPHSSGALDDLLAFGTPYYLCWALLSLAGLCALCLRMNEVVL